MMGFKTFISAVLGAVLLVAVPVWNPFIGKAWAPTAVEYILYLQMNLTTGVCTVAGITTPSDIPPNGFKTGDTCGTALAAANALKGKIRIRELGTVKVGEDILTVVGLLGPEN
jgi:hypothetical protein